MWIRSVFWQVVDFSTICKKYMMSTFSMTHNLIGICNAKILHSSSFMQCNVLLKPIFILYKQGRELKIHTVQDIPWKIREALWEAVHCTIFLNIFYSDKDNEYYVKLYSCWFLNRHQVSAINNIHLISNCLTAPFALLKNY